MKIAFVTPWYGPDATGGMETVAHQTVTQLHQAGLTVEILTTCIRNFQSDWSTNYHRPGLTTENGIPVRRFAVKKRDKVRFDQINAKLMQRRTISAAEEQLFLAETFRCPDLYDHIAQQGSDTLFFFIPYLFASTYFGVRARPQNSLVIPCLHDEGYAYLELIRTMMTEARGHIFLSNAESQIAARLYPQPPNQLRVVMGSGVADVVSPPNPERFRQKYNLHAPFVLYIGRREPGKNTPLLLDYWRRFVATGRSQGMKLVLIGKGDIPGDVPEVVDLGFVSPEDKQDALAAAMLLCQPSTNESFSLVMMESWLAQRPVLVHGHCAVTHEHCLAAGGGLYFTNYFEFVGTIDYLRRHPEVADRMGASGRQYVLANFQWPDIVARFLKVIEAVQ